MMRMTNPIIRAQQKLQSSMQRQVMATSAYLFPSMQPKPTHLESSFNKTTSPLFRKNELNEKKDVSDIQKYFREDYIKSASERAEIREMLVRSGKDEKAKKTARLKDPELQKQRDAFFNDPERVSKWLDAILDEFDPRSSY